MTRLTWRIAASVISAALVFSSVPAHAQDDSPAFWGLGTNFHFVNANEFQSEYPQGSHWQRYLYGFWHFSTSSVDNYGWATVRLPTGSLVTGMTVICYDDLPAVDKDISVVLWRQWITAAGVWDGAEVASFQSSGAPGTTTTWVDIDPDHTIQYIDGSTAQSYVLNVRMHGSLLLLLRGVIIGWNRQISPAPAVATFADVPVGAFGFRHIEALAASGITAGCGGGSFCPNNTLTRAEMAVFLAKALGLHWAN